MSAVGHRHLGDLSDAEWADLLNDFADLVLHKHGVCGSLANYSLWRALDNERDKAQRPPAAARSPELSPEALEVAYVVDHGRPSARQALLAMARITGPRKENA